MNQPSPSVFDRSSQGGRDQTLTALIGVIGAVVGLLTAVGARGNVFAVVIGLATLCVTPGCAVACWQVTEDRLGRLLAVLAAGMTWSILACSALAWEQAITLPAVLILNCGVGGLASAVFLVLKAVSGRSVQSADGGSPAPRDQFTQVERGGRHSQRLAADPGPGVTSTDLYASPAPGGGQPPPRGRDDWDPRATSYDAPRLPDDPRLYPGQRELPRPAAQEQPASPERADAPDTSRRRPLILGAALAVTVILYAFSVVRADHRPVGPWGILPVLGVPFVVAAGLTVVILVLSLRSVRTAWPVAVAAFGLMLVEFNGTSMMLTSTPYASWTFKHFGVVDYLAHQGALNDPLDIYQQWPGFFAAAAALVHLSGLSSLSYANWAQLFFEALDSLALFVIARRLVPGRRVVPYITVMIFSAANWEGQFYFSPQSTAFLLSLVFMVFIVPLLEPERLRRPFANWKWLSIPPVEHLDGEKNGQVSFLRGTGIACLFAAIVITHQLSPYMVFASLIVLWILGVFRQRWLLLTVVVIAVVFPILHPAAVQQNSLLNGFSFANLIGKSTTATVTLPSAQQTFAGLLSRGVTLTLWGATAVTALTYWRRLGVIVIPLVLAVVPLGFVLVSNYGGEAIYRVFLFSSPWCAMIIAKRLSDMRGFHALRWIVVGAWVFLAALASAQAQDFGFFNIMSVPASEVAADNYFQDKAPDGAMMVLAASNFPSRGNRNYVNHDDHGASQNDPGLDTEPEFSLGGLKKASAEYVAQATAGLAGKDPAYLVVALPSMEAYSQYYGIYTPGTFPVLLDKLKDSDYWKLWYKNGSTYIFKDYPLGNANGTAKKSGK